MDKDRMGQRLCVVCALPAPLKSERDLDLDPEADLCVEVKVKKDRLAEEVAVYYFLTKLLGFDVLLKGELDEVLEKGFLGEGLPLCESCLPFQISKSLRFYREISLLKQKMKVVRIQIEALISSTKCPSNYGRILRKRMREKAFNSNFEILSENEEEVEDEEEGFPLFFSVEENESGDEFGMERSAQEEDITKIKEESSFGLDSSFETYEDDQIEANSDPMSVTRSKDVMAKPLHQQQYRSSASIQASTKKATGYSCVLCPNSYGRFRNMIRHTRLVHATAMQNMIACEICGMRVLTKEFLQEHVSREHQEGQREEGEENRGTWQISISKRLENLTCKTCSQIFDRASELARHNGSHHPDDDTLIKKKRISSKKVSKPECKSTKSEYPAATLDESFETDADMESPAEEFGSDYEGEKTSDQHDSDSDSDFELKSKRKTVHAKVGSSGSYLCVVCSEQFGRFSCMIRHVQKDHKEVIKEMKSCELCGMRVLTEKLMEEHTEREHTDQYGGGNEKTAPESQSEITVSKRIENLTCKLCSKIFDKPAYIKRHVEKIHTGPVDCDLCGKSFTTAGHLNAHKVRHSDAARRTGKYPCLICSAEYITFALMIHHLRMTHPDEIKNMLASHACEICGMRVLTEQFLAEHKEREHQNDPADGDQTDAGDDVEQKPRGSRIPTSKRIENLTCKDCCRLFNKPCELDIHVRSNHLNHEDMDPFVCEACGKTFLSKKNLRTHMALHSDLKKHKCETCGMEFRTRCHLNRHAPIHTDLREFLCSICGAAFRHDYTLKNHHIAKHGGGNGKLHDCRICGKGFKLKMHLRQHLLSKSHGGVGLKKRVRTKVNKDTSNVG